MCNKISYGSATDAKKQGIIIRANKRHFSKRQWSQQSDGKLIPYQCPHCDNWHLTTKHKKNGKQYRKS